MAGKTTASRALRNHFAALPAIGERVLGNTASICNWPSTALPSHPPTNFRPSMPLPGIDMDQIACLNKLLRFLRLTGVMGVKGPQHVLPSRVRHRLGKFPSSTDLRRYAHQPAPGSGEISAPPVRGRGPCLSFYTSRTPGQLF